MVDLRVMGGTRSQRMSRGKQNGEKVTVNQCKILEALPHNPHATQAELAVIVGITRKSIIANMKRLQDQGLIRRKGSDKNGLWLVDATEWQVLP